MNEEQRRVLDEAMAELRKMLDDHEKYKEEYAKKYEGLSEEEADRLYDSELEQANMIIEKTGMKTQKNDDDKE